MPEPSSAPEIGTISQWITLVGVLLGGLVTAIIKLSRSVKKPPLSPTLTVDGNAELVRLAKENADLRSNQMEADLRHEFWVEIRRVRDDMEAVSSANRKSFYDKLDEVTGNMAEMQASIARIEGLLGGRQPRR